MKQNQRLAVSVVIPCFNEESNITACLKALSGQNQKLHEIIVVDNNSTDGTVRQARRFKRVKIIQEPKQGLISARNAGMDIATGDIIARIDADSRPDKDWSSTVSEVFLNEPVQAITGTGYFYDAPFKVLYRWLRNLIAVHINKQILGHHMLWGTNMALRRSCWLSIRSDVCSDQDIMEDLDLAFHVHNEYGGSSIAYKPKMRADISARRAMVNLKQNYLYLKMWPKTLKNHGYTRAPFVWPVLGIALVGGIAVSASIRLYNEQEQKLILSQKQWQSKKYYDRDNP